MSEDDFEISVDELEAIPIEEIASEELFKHCIRVRNTWQDNLLAGRGATGVHGSHRERGPAPDEYHNTGEAVNDVTISPQHDGAFEYEIGGDSIQLAIAEEGRRPGGTPPYDVIDVWARENQLQPDPGQSWEDMVDAIRFAIERRGLDGFGPARAAAREHDADALADAVGDRIDEHGE